MTGRQHRCRAPALAEAEDAGRFLAQFDLNADMQETADLWFFFETLAKCWRPFVGKHYDLARQMCNYWANFIRSGDPNGTDSTGEPLPCWDAFTADHPACMVFDDKSHQTVEAPDEKMSLMIRRYLIRQLGKG